MILEKRAQNNNGIKTKPFLKWAGGKTALLPDILKFIPPKYNTYYEPFLGSGALFLALQPKKAYLSDINKKLIDTFIQLRNNPESVIKHLKTMRYNKKFYYNIRSKKSGSPAAMAARFIYLNKTCWNGLYRENSNGDFNVPIGRYTKPLICDQENIKNITARLKQAIITTIDFEKAIKNAHKDDLIYFDPPYVTSHNNNGFIEYNSKIFSWSGQQRLEKVMRQLDNKGCKVIMSNADHKAIRKLYKRFYISSVKRRSLIAANSNNRKRVTELIITNFKYKEK